MRVPVSRVGLGEEGGVHEIRMSHSAGITSNMHCMWSSLKSHSMHDFNVDVGLLAHGSLQTLHFCNIVTDKY